jgi:hypothetical protein
LTELWDNVALRRSVLGDALPRRLLDKIGLETILEALGHEVKEGELAGLVAVLVHEAAGQVAAEDGTEVCLATLCPVVCWTRLVWRPSWNVYASPSLFNIVFGLRLKLSQALGHEVKEGELAGLVAVLVHEAAGQVDIVFVFVLTRKTSQVNEILNTEQKKICSLDECMVPKLTTEA